MKELCPFNSEEISYQKVLSVIREKIKAYIESNNIKSLVIGVSGGLDSGVNCAVLQPICKELGISLIGVYIHIESNKEDEMARANKIGKAFCTSYSQVDLTSLYLTSLPIYENGEIENPTYEDKIRRGNIKARMRMIYLYNLAQKNKGIVVDNDNMTEHLLGFWTLNGDVGDITPLASLLKTEVYALAKYMVSEYEKNGDKFADEINALHSVISAVPTDGLGISSSDVEQFGVKSYNDVDDILVSYKNDFGYDDVLGTFLYPKYGKECVDKIISRHKNSSFKRNHPKKIFLSHNEII